MHRLDWLGWALIASSLAVAGCKDDPAPSPEGGTAGSTGASGTDGVDETADSSSGEPIDVDAECSLRYAWEPGVGDITSFPTSEMAVADPAMPSGYRVALSLDSHPDLSSYGPYAEEIGTALSSLDGFGIQGEAFARFDGAFAASVLPPADAQAGPDDAIGLVVVPEDGAPYLAPVGVELTDDGQTVMLHPMFGLPPSTLVALWIARDFGVDAGDCVGASPGMRGLLDAAAGDHGRALEALVELGVVQSSDDLAVLQPYPTQSAPRESYAIAEHIAGLPAGDFSLTDQACEDLAEFRHCTSTFAAWDYRNADGVITVDVEAVEPQAPWDLVVHAWLPLDGAGPYPTVLFGHGLTGSAEQGEAVALTAAPKGYAVVAISALMHGDHPSLDGMNLSGLAATLAFFAADLDNGKIDALRLRDHFRQSTYDKLALTRLLDNGADLDGDATPDVDPSRMAYMGLSLGAVMGNELLALTDAYSGGVLVMPGGRVTTVMTDPMGSFVDVLSLLVPADFSDGDERRLFAILQTVLDAGDPATYGGNILQQRLPFAAETPDLLVGAVLDDDIVVNAATWALARATGLDIVPPTLREVPGLGQTAATPLSGNLMGGATAGLVQFDVVEDEGGTVVPATHLNLSFSNVGLAAWWGFLDPLLTDGEGIIIDPYEAVGLAHAG